MPGQETHGYEFVSDCQLRAATDLFRYKWDPIVLAALSIGPRRRGTLHTSMRGMSEKVLTEVLNRLLSHGLVERKSYRESPPRVEYELTELGNSFVNGPMRALGSWITDHGEELLNAQEQATLTSLRGA